MVDVIILTRVDRVVVSYKSITLTLNVKNFRMLFLKVKSFVLCEQFRKCIYSCDLKNGDVVSMNIAEQETAFLSIVQKNSYQVFYLLNLIKY